MEAEAKQSAASRIFWLAIVLALLAGGAGGWYWYEHSALKYERITNAKRV